MGGPKAVPSVKLASGRRRPFALKAGPGGEFAYVTSVLAGTLSVIDVATNAVTAAIAVGGRPGDLGIVPAPRR